MTESGLQTSTYFYMNTLVPQMLALWVGFENLSMCALPVTECNEITVWDSSKRPNNSAIKHPTPQFEARMTVMYLTG